jgi:hypothetical protein
MGSQATVRDCSMLGIAVYYTKDILPNILYNCSGDIISNSVAQNARYYQHKKDRPESTHRLNVADDVHSVLNMFQNSAFIREVFTNL